ncbi:MAG: hypothetical protein SGI92_29815 [Bryobacteraceae bacterium]|nr:hypothetical protein [Bryobacteraceae bacterium]
MHPPGLISISFLVCEKILQEEGGVLSAIRIVDVFTILPIPNVLIQDRAIDVALLVAGNCERDTNRAIIDFQQIMPNGETQMLGSPLAVTIVTSPEHPASPAGFQARINLMLSAKYIGCNWIVLSYNGQEVARAALTLSLAENSGR